jgi:hypothetical protein
MHQLAWARLVLARRPWIYWLATAVVASLVSLGATRALGDVDAARRSWGEQQAVWIATDAIEPGQAIASERRDVPRALVPPGAVTDNPGAIARQRIGPGEIVTTADVAAAGSAGLIPAGWVAFTVPAPVDHYATGDHVGVYAGDQFVAAGLVVGKGESELMVAVPADAAPAMAAALLADAVTLALTPGP